MESRPRRRSVMLLRVNAVDFATLFAILLSLGFGCNGVSELQTSLLHLKHYLVDPDRHLENWEASVPVCKWNGVGCDSQNRVAELVLDNMNLNGSFPFSEALCNLTNLQVLSLSNNNLNQSLEKLTLDNCKAPAPLRTLNLSSNYIFGRIPDTVSELKFLQILDLSSLYLEGNIPASLSKLSNLTHLDLAYNYLTGAIPVELGELRALRNLSLSQNTLTSMPDSLGNLAQLRNLFLQQNNLTGTIPESLGNLTELIVLQLSDNNLTGPVPEKLTRLSQLQFLQAYNNHLSGSIPAEIWNLTALKQLDLANNQISGEIPAQIGTLKHLELVHLYQNKLQGPIPASMASIPALKYVRLFQNQLSGELPAEMGSKSILVDFEVSENRLNGSIPANLCRGNQLLNLSLYSNEFSGSIPREYGQCTSFVRLLMHNNSLSGKVPAGIWSAPDLMILELHRNRFYGQIPAEISRASKLSHVILDDNGFSGEFPEQLSKMQSLYKISASRNSFSGGFPGSVCKCPQLSTIEVSHNNLSGTLPDFDGCNTLVSIAFASNHLSGEIPASLGRLPVLTYIDLSHNNFSGPIPAELVSRKIVLLNVSYNDLSGRVPDSLTLPALDLQGNPQLCGTGTSKSCNSNATTSSSSTENRNLIWILIAAFGAAGIILAAGIVLIHRSCRNSDSYLYGRSQWKTVNFSLLGLNEDEVADKLDTSNMIGSGGSGTVHRVTLTDGGTVAVKKLWKSGFGGRKNDSSLATEMETVAKVRHRNIVKLLCCCCNEETTFLVYEYLPNGSLAEVLHSPDVVLPWATRLRIALGTARGLAYLHHDFVPQILHRDIKSNNILLDFDFEPKIADFGLAKVRLSNVGQLQSSASSSMSSVVGSYGYMAPEHGYSTKVDEKIDVYSYGVVLMELITGKRAVEADIVSGDIVDLVKWVRGKANTKDGIPKLLDARITDEADQQEMITCLRIALLCTSVLPQKRPSMREVVEMLEFLASDQAPHQTLLSLGPLFQHSFSTKSNP